MTTFLPGSLPSQLALSVANLLVKDPLVAETARISGF